MLILFLLINNLITYLKIFRLSIFYTFVVLYYIYYFEEAINKKKVGKWVALCCTVGYKWVTVMDGVKFEFNHIIPFYKKNDSERRQSVSQ